MTLVDADADGRINYNEFARCLLDGEYPAGAAAASAAEGETRSGAATVNLTAGIPSARGDSAKDIIWG